MRFRRRRKDFPSPGSDHSIKSLQRTFKLNLETNSQRALLTASPPSPTVPPAPLGMVVAANIREGVEEGKGRHNKERRERDMLVGVGWGGEAQRGGEVAGENEGRLRVLSEVAAWSHPPPANS